MKNGLDLTEGNIIKRLVALSLPIMGTSFIQMAYNMIDMIWVGRIGSSAVASVGTAGFFYMVCHGICNNLEDGCRNKSFSKHR